MSTYFLVKKKGLSSNVSKLAEHYSGLSLFSASKMSLRSARFRAFFFKYEGAFNILRFIRISPVFSKTRRLFINLQLDSSLKYASLTRFNRISPLVGRSSIFSKDFKACRISFRQLGSRNLLPGVFKSSW